MVRVGVWRLLDGQRATAAAGFHQALFYQVGADLLLQCVMQCVGRQRRRDSNQGWWQQLLQWRPLSCSVSGVIGGCRARVM